MFPQSLRNFLIFLVSLSAFGCVEQVDPAFEGYDTPQTPTGSPLSADALGVLSFINHPTTTFEMLDGRVGLDVRAAAGLIEHRNGRDGAYPSADDDRFDSLAEIEAVRHVGPAAIERLLAHARTHGWVADGEPLAGVFDEVAFTTSEAERALWLVNEVPDAVLNSQVGLDARAVASIVGARPIDTMEELAGLAHVGPVAMELIRTAAALVDVPSSTPGFVLTAADVAFYQDAMLTALYDDREFAGAVATQVPEDAAVEVVAAVEAQMDGEVEARVGQEYDSSLALVDELLGVLDALQAETLDRLAADR